MGPCGQWSSGHPWLGTLVRHVLCALAAMAITGVACSATLPPTPGPLGMCQATTPRRLVTLRGFAPGRSARHPPARPAAIAVATIALAAQHHLHAAACAQEQAGWSLHKHPGRTEVLDGCVPAGHTVVAPPSSARCRARYGDVRLAGYGHIAAAPTSFGMSAVVSRAPPLKTIVGATACVPADPQPHLARARAHRTLVPPAPPPPARQPGRPAGRPGWRPTPVKPSQPIPKAPLNPIRHLTSE